MKIEHLLQPKNLKIKSCRGFCIEGHYRTKNNYLLFEMRYESDIESWVLSKVQFNQGYNEHITFTTKYKTDIEKYNNLIHKQTETYLKEVEQLLQSLKKITIENLYKLDFMINGEKIISIKDKKTKKWKISLRLNQSNTIVHAVINPSLTRGIEFAFKEGDVEWLENLEEFRSYLLTKSKDRFRLLLQ